MKISDEQIERRLGELRGMAGEYAEAYAERTHLEEFKKSKLAMLMKEAEINGHKTVASQEREALANPEYIKLLETLRIATEKSERLRWQLEVAKLGVGVWQTAQANERMEMKVYGR